MTLIDNNVGQLENVFVSRVYLSAFTVTQICPQFSTIINDYQCTSEQGSSARVVSGYGLDDRATDVRSPTEAKGFLLYPLCPDRLLRLTQPPFPGAKARPGRDADHSPQSSDEVENE
jgi:hypothetical protein